MVSTIPRKCESNLILNSFLFVSFLWTRRLSWWWAYLYSDSERPQRRTPYSCPWWLEREVLRAESQQPVGCWSLHGTWARRAYTMHPSAAPYTDTKRWAITVSLGPGRLHNRYVESVTWGSEDRKTILKAYHIRTVVKNQECWWENNIVMNRMGKVVILVGILSLLSVRSEDKLCDPGVQSKYCSAWYGGDYHTACQRCGQGPTCPQGSVASRGVTEEMRWEL